jgi:lipid-A-disaccharide synthase
MNKEVVKELIQDDLNQKNLQRELNLLLNDTARQQQVKADYAVLKGLLHKGGNASRNAAESIVGFISSKKA